MNISILGHVCIDRNVSENASYTAPGSPAMFLSKIFAQLPDCKATIISSYGEDFLSYAGNASLYPPKPTSKHTLVYENVTKGKKRTQKGIFSEYANPVELTAQLTNILHTSDVLYIAPITPNFSPHYLVDIVKTLPAHCLKILSPQGYFRTFDAEGNVLIREFDEAGTILSLIDVVIVSEQDHPQMKELAKVWAKTYKIAIIVTTGENGAEVFMKDGHLNVSTEPVLERDIVDSVGSGDIFSAGFGYWYTKTKNIHASVSFANKLARECLFYTPENITIPYDELIKSSF